MNFRYFLDKYCKVYQQPNRHASLLKELSYEFNDYMLNNVDSMSDSQYQDFLRLSQLIMQDLNNLTVFESPSAQYNLIVNKMYAIIRKGA